MTWQPLDGRCRVCGSPRPAHDLNVAEFGAGCSRCGGSPLCEHCGHARRRHRGVFAGSRGHGCRGAEYDMSTLTKNVCACVGYAPRTESFGEAQFAAPVDPAEGPIPALRIAPPQD